MKKYEAVFIQDIRRADDEGAAFCKEFSEFLKTLGGSDVEITPMGRKQFTYPINKRRAGLYFDFVFEVAPEKILAIKDKYRLDERVLRNMILIYDRPENVVAAKLEEE